MTVGVVGDRALAAAVEDALDDADGAGPGTDDGPAAGDVVAGPAGDVLADDPAWVLAGGEAALLELVRAGLGVPVLAVDAGPGVPSIPAGDVGAAVAAVVAGDARTVTRPLLAADVGGDRAGDALFDVMLVADEPARIAEYSVHGSHGQVARFRADGVVVATPAGSHGYANAAGGPVVDPGSGVAAVVPVAPFMTDADHWVLDAGDVRLQVEREESVALVVDDREVATVGPGVPVELTTDGSVRLYDLEKL